MDKGFQCTGNSLLSILTRCSVVIHTPLLPLLPLLQYSGPWQSLSALLRTRMRALFWQRCGWRRQPKNYWCTHRLYFLLLNILNYWFLNWLKQSYQHLPGVASCIRPEAPRSLLHDRGHKFLQTLQASTAPRYIRKFRALRRSFTCCRWLLDRLHVVKRSLINWRDLDGVLWSRFGLLLSGWRCNPAAQALSSLDTLWRRRSRTAARSAHHCCCSHYSNTI